jgi:hypothetical protein
MLQPLRADRVAAVRLAGLRALPNEEVTDFCFDADEPLARSAVLRAAPRLEEKALGALTRSPHASIRRLASETLEVANVWDPALATSRLAARRLLERDRPSFLNTLRGRVATGAKGDRVRAIMLARALGTGHELELELLAVVASPADDWLVATAVAALGEVETGSAAEAVRRCVAHESGRVRANAAEAVLARAAQSHQAAPLDGRIMELKTDSHHRARSSALRGLLWGPDPLDATAVPQLAAMLSDGRPLHRLAGLWAVERLTLAPAPGSSSPVVEHLGDFATLVAQVARSEAEHPVRERAARCAARILARIRLMWREGAADISAKGEAA